jgi:hypothetical protein
MLSSVWATFLRNSWLKEMTLKRASHCQGDPDKIGARKETIDFETAVSTKDGVLQKAQERSFGLLVRSGCQR